MKFSSHFGVCSLLLSCLLLAAGLAHATEGDVYSLLDDTKLYQKANSKAVLVTTVKKGEQAIELNSTGEWKKIRLFSDGHVGWLPANFLSFGKAPAVVSSQAKSSQPELSQPKPSKPKSNQPLPDLTSKSDVEAKSKLAEQNMLPPKASVEGEAVSPMFEDGALSQMSVQAKSTTVDKAVTPVVKASNAALTTEVKAKPLASQMTQPGLPKELTVMDKKSVTKKSELELKKIISADVESMAEKSATGVYRFNKKANLRAGPDVKFDVVAWAREGSKAIEIAREGNWIRIQMQVSQRIGWVFSRSLEALSDNRSAHLRPVISKPVQLNKVPAISVPKPTVNASGKASDQLVLAKPSKLKIKRFNEPKSVTASGNKKYKPAINKTSTTKATGKPTNTLMQTTMIRKEPSALSDVLGWAGNGAQVQTIRQQGKWTKVRMQDSGRTGWIEAASLREPDAKLALKPKPQSILAEKKSAIVDKPAWVVPETADRKVVDTELAKAGALQINKPIQHQFDKKKLDQKNLAAVGAEKSLYAFNKNANLRAGPNVKLETVSWARKGSQARELDRKGDWVRIQMQVSQRIGWVFHQSLDVLKLGIAAAIAGPKVMATIDAKVSSPQQDQRTVAQTTVEQAKTISIATSNLYSFNKKSNLRAGPAAKYDAVSWAGQGAYAMELSRKADWVRVQMQVSKRIGWVFHRSLTLVKSGVSMPKSNVLGIQAMPASSNMLPAGVGKTKVKDSHQLYFFKRTSNLRAGPGKKYDRVAWGGRNESAQEIDHQGDWKRVRMTMSGKVGWVFNSYLLRAEVSGEDFIGSSFVHPLAKTETGNLYEVLRTTALHADANEFSDPIAPIGRGSSVAWLEERQGWVRVNPQVDGSRVGWIEARLLKQKMSPRKVEHKPEVQVSKKTVLNYKDRISKGETFNFSYAALEEALYRVPVEDIHIRIDTDDLRALFLKRQYDNSPFDIRLKTGRHKLHGTVKVLGSSTRIFKKKSLLIKLDKQSERWYGHRRIALRSMSSDKALMREWMAWKMMAALGMKVPEVHFTRVTFNRGEKTGLYLSVEWMGAEFLEANQLDPRGEFYQPDDAAHCGDLYSTEQLQTCFTRIGVEDADYSNLKAMAVAMNAATNSNIDTVLAEHFDDESVINWIAINALVTNGDTYNKNYWLHFHPMKRKWTMIPWDYNLTFGRVYDRYGIDAYKIFNDNFQYYYPPDVGAGNPIKDKVLRNPKLRARVEAKIKHLIGMAPNGSEHTFGWFSPTVMHARIGNLATVVGKEVYKDTFLTYGEGDFTKTYESLMHYVTAHDYFLKIKLFGDFPWQPEPPNQMNVDMPLPNELFGQGSIAAGGDALHLVDRGWGYFVAHLSLDEPLKSKATFDVRVEGGITPKHLPIAQSPRRCIERTWLLKTTSANVSVKGDVMFEYTQENSRRSEVAPTIHEEMLELWMRDGNRWKPVQTEVNEYSNTLIAKNVHMRSGHTYRFVACSPF